MKYFLCITVMFVFIIGCSKKITPANSGTPSGNSGAVLAPANSDKPAQPDVPIAPDPTATASKSATKEGGNKTPEMEGQATFNVKCGQCHGLKVTTDYTVERWVTVMQVMAIKANLSDVEKENVLAYVKANAKKG
jgi:mono/diheme cytochrome c family protein